MSLEYPGKNLESTIREFLKKNKTTTKASNIIPSNSDGVNGDIVIVQSGVNTALYGKVGGRWHRWNKLSSSLSQQTSRLHILNVGMVLTSGEKFLDLNDGHGTYSPQSGNTEYIGFLFPLRGRILRVAIKSEDAAGSTVVKIYKASAGTEVASTVIGNKTVNMAVGNIPYFFDYANASFEIGEAANVSINSTSNGNDTIISILMEFY